jgi:hypothetical protein
MSVYNPLLNLLHFTSEQASFSASDRTLLTGLGYLGESPLLEDQEYRNNTLAIYNARYVLKTVNTHLFLPV